MVFIARPPGTKETKGSYKMNPLSIMTNQQEVKDWSVTLNTAETLITADNHGVDDGGALAERRRRLAPHWPPQALLEGGGDSDGPTPQGHRVP